MATAIPFDLHLLAQPFARRRAVRARVIAIIATLITAWCAHVAMAVNVVPLSAPLVLVQSTSEQQSLGAAREPAQSAASSGVSEVVRMLGALTAVVGLAFAAKWWLRRSGIATRMQGGAFEIIARHSIGRGQSVLVVRFGPRLLCVEQARDGLRTLSELTDPAQVAATIAEARGVAPTEHTVDLRRGKDTGS